MRAFSRILIWGVIVGAGIAIVLGVHTMTQPTQIVRFGEPVRQDDFLYTVAGVSKSASIGNDGHTVAAKGVFYVCSVEVTNRALRVDYRWDPSIVYVTDAAGHRFSVSLPAQRALDALRPVDLIVAPGSTTRFQVVFDLPRAVDHPALAFSNGIVMGDVFDGAAYMRVRVPLD